MASAFCSGPRLQFTGALWESSGLLAQRLQTAREAWWLPPHPAPSQVSALGLVCSGSKEGPHWAFLALFPSPDPPPLPGPVAGRVQTAGIYGSCVPAPGPSLMGFSVRQGICPQGPSGFLGMAGSLLLTYEAVLLRSDSGGGCHPKELW